ncbi:hypothetical protein D3C72_2096710 [compost metagenome]
MPPCQDPIILIAQKRELYDRLRASLIACGRSLSECACWHYDADRLDGIARIGRHIQDTTQAMQTVLGEIHALEAQVLGA